MRNKLNLPQLVEESSTSAQLT
ncbi:protein of unknown function [Methylococcus capsulatus]|uniref:Uncharacterized protein n=1 Tax=Methylococcus capsulatus TaxID=414 RepID=A0AA35UPR1_METCP|nr:protein of unknown function [Methylococcus capsulatus]